DVADNVYLAMIDSKKVIRIDSNGKPETILAANSLWTVTSGLFDKNGNMWVLENSATNEVRARKIDQQSLADGKLAATNVVQPHLLITILTVAAIVILFLIIGLILRRKNKQIHFSF